MDWGTGHEKRIITEMTDVGFNQSASSSLNSYHISVAMLGQGI